MMLEIGTVVDGKYKILRKIGQGGMSIVYLAMNERANKQWAIKEVRKDGVKDFGFVKQGLAVETDMLKKLRHPSLPGIIDIIEDKDMFLIVMDYIEGNPLSKVLEESGAQPQEDVIRWAKQLCDVLGYLHTRTPAIIYRDMKPANVMLKPDGNVTLIDFGTAREFKEKNIADTTCLGTVGYAAPEQFGGMGQTDARTDIYCLGATLYHLVTGMNPREYPYEIRPVREIDPALSPGLEKIILKCTRRNPQDRYQSCAELMYALESYGEIDDVYRKKQKKKLVIFFVSAALTAALGASSVWGYFSAKNKKSEKYDESLKTASSFEDYYDAILTDPGRSEAYEQLNLMLVNDFVLTKEEGQQLLRLQIGLERENKKGFRESYDVLKKLKEKNPEGYQDICYQIGSSFLYYYDVNVDRDRYSSAKRWFKEAAEKYPIARIYCDIADCLEIIDQYNGAKIKQTEKMFEEYENLWRKICELKMSADELEDFDSAYQIWTEINNMINTQVVPLIGVTSAEDMISILESISVEAGKVNKPAVKEEIKKLQDSISSTIQKIESVRERGNIS